MTIKGLASSVSAIKAFETKMASTADNIANSQSQKFKKTRVVLSEQKNNTGVKAQISRVNTPGDIDTSGNELSNVDIADEISSMIPTSRGLEANIKSAQTMDEMTGTIINIIE